MDAPAHERKLRRTQFLLPLTDPLYHGIPANRAADNKSQGRQQTSIPLNPNPCLLRVPPWPPCTKWISLSQSTTHSVQPCGPTAFLLCQRRRVASHIAQPTRAWQSPTQNLNFEPDLPLHHHRNWHHPSRSRSWQQSDIIWTPRSCFPDAAPAELRFSDCDLVSGHLPPNDGFQQG